MDHEIKLRRRHDKSLCAETQLPFDDERRELHFSTSKGSGGLSTSASVCQRSEDGLSVTHAIGFGRPGMGDFYRLVEQERTWRCSEKNVMALHKRALERLDDIKAMAQAHYAAKETA
jgi:hypothetical protein